MRVKFALLVLFMGCLALLLGPTQGLGQRGGRGNRGGGRNFDPGMMFDRMSQGQSAITIAQLPGAEDMQAWAVKNGISNGQLTRAQFISYSQSPEAAAARQRMWGGGGGGRGGGRGGPPTGGPPGAGPQGGWGRGGGDINTRIDETFRRADKNADGFLDPSEMSENLRAELDKWDVDKNKLIDINEYRKYYKAWDAKQQAERGGGGQGWPGPGGPDAPAVPEKPKYDLDKKVTVYRAGKLPKDLPQWFKDCDIDGDAQISLYEWKEKGGTVEQFKKFDRNGDGFLTYEEVLKGNMLALTENPLTGAPLANGPGGPSAWAARIFDGLANGKPTLVIADVANDTMRGQMLEWAQNKGINNGQLTREQFASYQQEQRQARGFGGFRGGRGPRGGGGAPRGGRPGRVGGGPRGFQEP